MAEKEIPVKSVNDLTIIARACGYPISLKNGKGNFIDSVKSGEDLNKRSSQVEAHIGACGGTIYATPPLPPSPDL